MEAPPLEVAPMDGAIVVDKPQGWTSHDVVSKFRRIARMKKVGHLGTLDPIGTGVLPLVLGSATRMARFYLQGNKIYECIVRFGWATDTYDREGKPVEEPVPAAVDAAQLEPLLERFRGEFLQAPPPVSAKKIGGKRAYELAREKKPVTLEPVKVHVYELTVLEVSGADVRLRAHCSGGTYLRAIAHELGQAYGCGAHVRELRRVASSEFRIEHARTIEQLESLAAEERLIDALIPASDLLPGIPEVYVDESAAAHIRNGR
ncbi:MAG: tRNA pseudouridine(55) synthase TruB, partial [Acidobacteriia bacterium]|nr:tRNA pseudouridine(55) synthase TruB [Terriglobia bacterium]